MEKFTKKLLSALLGATVLCSVACQPTPPPPPTDTGGGNYTPITDADFLTANGTALYNADGEEVRLQGTNFGGWLHMEGWMDGGGGDYNHYAVLSALRARFTESETQELLKIYQDAFITETDVENVYSLGLNMIRVPFFWTEIMDDEGQIREDAFYHLDWLTAECKKRGLYVLLDLHGAPGGHSSGWLTGGHTGSNELWSDEECQARTVRIWEALATHYKDEPTICGYGLLNEPVPPENSPLTTAAIYDRLYDAVRAIDSRHAVVLGAFFNFDALGSPESNGWTNVVYETHHYDDGNKTAENQQNFVAGNLQYLRGYQQLWQVPILAGEFNFWSAEDAWRTWLYALNETGISWSNWTYKHTDLERDNNWGLYYQPMVEKVDYARDSYDEIARKWRGYATENYTKNEFLTGIFTWATADNERVETAKTSFTAQAYQTDGDNAAKLLLDGDIFTRWSNCEVQGNGTNQWIEVDFGETLNLSGIGLFTWNNDYTRAYKVLADIEGEWRVIARGNGRFGRTEITFEPLLTEKIRVVQTGNADWNYWSVYELSFYTA